MKKVVLIGNGFDLYHHLPTTYANFLHTVSYILKKSRANESIGTTVGEIFKNLVNYDTRIKNTFNEYKDVLYQVKISNEDINAIYKNVNNNCWFNYLVDSFDEDLGWIDIENETARVLAEFRQLFQEIKGITFLLKENGTPSRFAYILSKFDFFYSLENTGLMVNVHYQSEIKKEYVLESPLKSENLIPDKTKILDTLFDEYRKLCRALSTYLRCFVNNVLIVASDNRSIKNNPFFSDNIFRVISFNYTDTYKIVYGVNPIKIHGDIDAEIVMGINPDQYDDLDNLDTSFLKFKKYFQRIFYNTDLCFIEFLHSFGTFAENDIGFEVYVIGHSLDITDKDIIQSVFERAQTITIFYYDENAKASYINNLVKMYGKAGFELLRLKQNLKFLPINEMKSIYYGY